MYVGRIMLSSDDIILSRVAVGMTGKISTLEEFLVDGITSSFVNEASIILEEVVVVIDSMELVK
jgi:hypothetical protein